MVVLTMETTVTQALEKAYQEKKDQNALSFKENNEWKHQSWADYRNTVRMMTESLYVLGMRKGDTVAIFSQNRYEWLIAHMATIAAGGASAGIYPTVSAEQCFYILEHSQAKVLFVENIKKLRPLEPLLTKLSKLETIVLMEGSEENYDTTAKEAVLTWQKILTLSPQMTGATYRTLVQSQKPDDLATLVYTSGTTGHPKAVMLSHRNLSWTAYNLCKVELNLKDSDHLISYLPLSHIAEQMTTIYGPLFSYYSVTFCPQLDLLPEMLKEVRPTLFLGVPRIWEKMQDKIERGITQQTGFKSLLIHLALKLTKKYSVKKEEEKYPFIYSLCTKIVFKKIHKSMGLDHCRLAATAAAPISPETLKFFESIGLPLAEIYGMSECSGPSTMSLPKKYYKPGTVGKVLPGTDVQLAEDGEILISGPHVFQGYYRNEKASKACLNQDNYLCSGDLGSFSTDGYLKVTGRKKNIIITAGGENIPTDSLEKKYQQIEGIEHCILVGDGKKYLSLLISPDPIFSQENILINKESPQEDQAKTKEKEDPFYKYLRSKISEINETIAKVQTVKKFVIIQEPFTTETGELTPTMKVKRAFIINKYQDEITKLYN